MSTSAALRTVALAPIIVVSLFAIGPSAAGDRSLSIGVVEDAVKQPTVAAARAKLELVRNAGFDTVEVSQTWTLNETAAPPEDVAMLRNVYGAARGLGMHVILGVYPSGSSQTPLTPAAIARFATFAARLARDVGAREVIVGNEPNLNRFWLPQFGPHGSDVAAPAYLRLLARTYDALKAVNPAIVVDGGAVSAHGGDQPTALRPTHSPTEFMTSFGEAYRASRRARKVMDAFDLHPYEGSSRTPPATTHGGTTIAIADYPKLVSLLGHVFHGTRQPGSTLPIVYGEFGVETEIPAAKARFYTGKAPTTVHPVSALTQGRYYAQAIGQAFCQPHIRTLLLFHAFDEPSLAGWQSGVYYADGTPKRSLTVVRAAIAAARAGTIARCTSR